MRERQQFVLQYRISKEVEKEIERQLETLPRSEIARESINRNGAIFSFYR